MVGSRSHGESRRKHGQTNTVVTARGWTCFVLHPPPPSRRRSRHSHFRHSPPKIIQKMQQPSSRSPSVSTRLGPSPRPHQVNTQTKLIDTVHGRILCVADIRGHFSSLNDLAREENAKAVIHTGDFGFFGAFRHPFFSSDFDLRAQRHPASNAYTTGLSATWLCIPL